MTTSRDRLGPLEAALRDRDADALYRELAKRATREPETGCLRFHTRRPNGYGYFGRGKKNRLAHRAVAWAAAGFPGPDLKSYPAVAHLCATRDCIEILHLRPVTAFMNTIEANLRAAIVTRIAALETAIRELDPDHEVLTAFPPLSETPGLRRPATFESAAERLRRLEKANRRHEAQQRNREFRFRQVAQVHRLIANGMTEKEALEALSFSRRLFQHWQDEYREWLDAA